MGVKFQLEKAVAVISCAAIPDDQVIDSVIKTGELKACIGFPNQSINVQPYALPSIQPLPKPQPLIICSPTDQTISELEKIGNQPSSVSASCVSGSSAPEQSKQTKTVNQAPADKNKKEKMIFSVSSAAQPNVPNSYFEETLKSTSNQQTPEENDNENTLVPQKSQLPVIMSLTSGEKKWGLSGETSVGRKKRIQESLADVTFEDSSKFFSRSHFKIICVDNICTLLCTHPNGISVNGFEDLGEGERLHINDITALRIPSRKSVNQCVNANTIQTILIVASYQASAKLWNAQNIAAIESLQTGEIRVSCDSGFVLGRANPWKSGAVASLCISAQHADIKPENDQFYYYDHSSNGTLINGIYHHNDKIELHNGDKLTIAGNEENKIAPRDFIFHYAAAERKPL